MNVDLYVRRDAWFHRLDPRTKFATTLAFVVIVLVASHWPVMAIALLALHVLAASSRIPARHLMLAWRTLLPITVMILLLSSLTLGDAGGAALVSLGPLTTTTETTLQALTMALRVDALAFAFLVMLWATEQGEMVTGLTRLGLSHAVSLTLAIAMQFVPTFGRIFEEILDAQRSRGLVIPRLNPFGAARAYLPVLIPLLITALRTADHLSMALSARGYAPDGLRSSRRQLQLARADWLALAILLALVGATVVWRVVAH